MFAKCQLYLVSSYEDEIEEEEDDEVQDDEDSLGTFFCIIHFQIGSLCFFFLSLIPGFTNECTIAQL